MYRMRTWWKTAILSCFMTMWYVYVVYVPREVDFGATVRLAHYWYGSGACLQCSWPQVWLLSVPMFLQKLNVLEIPFAKELAVNCLVEIPMKLKADPSYNEVPCLFWFAATSIWWFNSYSIFGGLWSANICKDTEAMWITKLAKGNALYKSHAVLIPQFSENKHYL